MALASFFDPTGRSRPTPWRRRAAWFALAVTLGLATSAAAQPGFVGVDVRDVATRHYYNPFDGLLLDRTRYPEELIDAAETLCTLLETRGSSMLGQGRLSSVRAMGFAAGRLEFVAVLLVGKKPVFRAGSFFPDGGTVEQLRPVALSSPELFISLKDLTLSLRGADGAVVLVDPIGAGGYRKNDSRLLMTPLMKPEATRTPGRAYMEASRYRGGARGTGYMIPSRSHPDYYDRLPFVRLRRFDQPVDEYAIHGPISRGGTFPITPALRGEKLAGLRQLQFRQRTDPAGLLDELADSGLIDDESRLVRGRISNGCIRLRAREIRELYAVLDSIDLGVPVSVSYEADPRGAFHPFLWETRRFAVATDERDEDGLTVMFTGTMPNAVGKGEGNLPFPDAQELTEEENRAQRALKALSGRSGPSDYRRLGSLVGSRPAAARRAPDAHDLVAERFERQDFETAAPPDRKPSTRF
ncbi:MAG: L,D-transpeptidase [Candidatus Riflebacteria bacterium]|nr:L,D-transpeptidase [Candidatus Riflebacteria bacterium]